MKINLTLPGQTILEVLIAATLISLSIIAAFSLSNNSQKAGSYARDLNSATTYNNQVIDWLRNLRTTIGWGEFIAAIAGDNGGKPTYCLKSLPSNTADFISLTNSPCTATDVIPDTYFIREAALDLSLNSLKVNVTTSWQTHSTSTETVLNDWLP